MLLISNLGWKSAEIYIAGQIEQKARLLEACLLISTTIKASHIISLHQMSLNFSINSLIQQRNQ